jgi:hypothetical protein
MPHVVVTLGFPNDLNVSVQETDIVYYCKVVNDQSGKNHPSAGSVNTKPIKLGSVVGVNRNANTIDVRVTAHPTPILTAGDDYYLFFSKDRRVNHSGIIGYFIEAEYRNYTTLPAEIFATAVDYVESSK